MKRRIISSMMLFYFYKKVNRQILARKILILFINIALFLPLESFATHISGADMSYKWISGNTFEITLTLYRDCSGIAAPNSVSVNCRSASCGYNLNVTLYKIAGTGQEITVPCYASASVCNGGTSPGIQQFEYTGNITLPAQCADWVFGYSICCRNCAITTLSYMPNNCSGVPATYVEATLNNLAKPNNSSPVFTNIPVSFFCIGQTFHYNHGAYDSDGDSLVYSFVDPHSSASASVVFNPGYSATNPISSSPPVFLGVNGDIIINPTALEVGVMAILVKEYENGILIGSVVRDMEIWTFTCTNALPTATGINGTAIFNTIACPGVPFSFNIYSNDADTAQNITMDWNYGIPGGIFTSTSASRPVGTFSWTPSFADARSLPYIFTVTVQDNNCPSNGFQTYTYSVTVHDLSITTNATNSLCANPGTGTAVAIPAGDAPFQYSWSPGGATTSSINGLAAGNYTSIITDNNGCTVTATATVTSPSQLNSSLLSVSNATCNGSSNGSIAISAFGGTSPYSYSWTPSAGAVPIVIGLAAGMYTVTVSDAHGCTNTRSATISQPAALSATTSAPPLLCNGDSNGFASVLISGGTPVYIYSWSSGGTMSSVNSLTAGSYSVIATDAHGCTVSASVNLVQPASLNGSVASSTPVSCYGGNNGSCQVMAVGGSLPYSYSWFPSGNTSASAAGLSSGNYTVTITDAHNCTTTVPVNINQPPMLISSINSFGNVMCADDTSGFANVFESGGTAPYFYSWTPSGENTSSVNGLSAGNYSVTVTDINGCSSVSTITISQPYPLSLNILSVKDVSCFGGSDGSAAVSISGGTSPVTFQWSPTGGNTSIANNLSAGIYTVTATDVNNCATSLSLTINEPSSLSATVSSFSTSCYGGSDGSAALVPSGGTTPYSYLWSPGGSTSIIATGLSSGNYNVTVSDTNGCTFTTSVLVDQPQDLSLTVSTTSAACGNSNGSASVSVTGGTPGYNYFWSPSSTSSTITNIPAGAYTVTVEDANGCTSVATAGVSNIGAPGITLTSLIPVSCEGGSNGSAAISISGGFGPYTIQWLPFGGSGLTASGLIAGNYTASVTDNHQCTAVIVVNIPEPPALQTNTFSTPVSCFGRTDGSALVNVSGGTGTYNYSWNTGIGNSPSGNNLPAGNYFVTVTDQNGCTEISQVIINQPLLLTASINNSTHVSCYGSNDGSAIVTVNGGGLPYTYLWNPTGDTISTISGLIAGNYSVAVSDMNGCTTVTAVIINQPAELNAQISTSPGTCDIPNGTAAVNISGGISPYTYLWSQTGATTSSITGLSPGNYVIAATDANGCQISAFVDVMNTGTIIANLAASTNVTCNGGNDGTAVINVINGTTPYSYNWQPSGGNSPVANGLAAGNYSVTISDTNGCIQIVPVIINEPPALSATVIATHISCAGAGDGMATVIPSGGTGAYSFQWLPSGTSSPTINFLNGGNFSIIVTDANGCTTLTPFTITEPAPVILSTTSTPAGCQLSNGSAMVNVSGGASPYNYLWNPGGMHGNIANGISAGSYTVTVTDANNCISSTSASVSSTTGPSISLVSTTPVSCHGGADGSAEANVTGGVAPFIFNWSPNGGVSAIAHNLSAGNYSVSVTDSNNCSTAIPVVINSSSPMNAAITTTPAKCHGGADGSAIAAISGGTAPYTFLWSSGDSTANASGLSHGNYSLTVTDDNGCASTFNTTISEPSAVNLDVYTAPVHCHGSYDGFGSVIATGGTPGYSYLWSNGKIYSTVSDFFAGYFTVTVTDAHGCETDTAVTITEPPPVIMQTTHINESCAHSTDGSATITVTGGTPPYTYAWSPVGGNSNIANNLPTGGYDIVVHDNNGCMSKINVYIASPAPIVLSTSVVPVKCHGGNDGIATVNAYGGTPPFTYFWSNGSTNPMADNLSSGTYTVIVTDNNSCTAQTTVNINQPAPIDVTIESPAPICIGQSAILKAQSTNGISPYSFLWNNGIHGYQQTVSPIISTTYSVIVTDAHWCSSSPAFVTVNVNPELLAIGGDPDTICGGNPVTLHATGSGGNGGPYNYRWDFGASGNYVTISPVTSSNYWVVISDNCGTPPVTVSMQVIVNPSPVVNFIPQPVKGCEPLLVNFEDRTDLNGTEYYWNFGDGTSDTSRNPVHAYLNAGNYTVNHIVKSESGCTGKIMIPDAVIVYPVPIAAFTNVPEVTSIYSPSVSFYDESTNAAGWEWDFGDNSGNASGKNTEHRYQDTGMYSVKLITTSDKGCIDTAFGKVIIKGEFAVYFPNAFTPNNDGVNDNFMALGIGIRDFEMYIYDRWGLRIFYSTDITKGWDGKIQDSEITCQTDVYVYKINLSDLQGKVHNYVGRVSLVR